MFAQPIAHTFRRYLTLQTHRISALPIVILMPHSACNCQCIMCDIWKGNKNLKQLEEKDLAGLLDTFRRFGTRQVVMSGGEALLNANFFRLCELLKTAGIRVSLLSTGLLLKHHATDLLRLVDDIIVSLDGDQVLHDSIRNVPGAFAKLKAGVQTLKTHRPGYPITARTVLHKLNFRKLGAIIEAAKEIGLDQLSFLPADISSTAFNRQTVWDEERRSDVLPGREELAELQAVLDETIARYRPLFANGFIAESPQKLQKIHDHYAAFYGLNPFPYKKCNAPWVSTVIEADGSVRPCFFHEVIGNIREQSLHQVLNSEKAIQFRKTLDIAQNDTCKKCVCYLNLPPAAAIA